MAGRRSAKGGAGNLPVMIIGQHKQIAFKIALFYGIYRRFFCLGHSGVCVQQGGG
jgi:hypothetical protein